MLPFVHFDMVRYCIGELWVRLGQIIGHRQLLHGMTVGNSVTHSGPTVHNGSGPTVGKTTVGLQCTVAVGLQWVRLQWAYSA